MTAKKYNTIAILLILFALGAAPAIMPPVLAAAEAQTGDTAEQPAPDSGMQKHADAVKVVEKLHSALLSVMKKGKGVGFQDRYKQLEPVISSLFDTPLICKVILGRYWSNLNQKQQSDFISLFNKLSTSTYASRFDSYNGEEFHTLGVEELHKGRLLINTELTRPNDKPVKLDYLMHQDSNNNWLIISVIADGVNDLSLKRAEYAVVIRDKGYEGLLDNIKGKITKMESGK
ncbi:MAG: ABC transporter substrate-binding protein [Gammaproteobacteria bacterium]|jgi:phospholipid transport system substrate-binding protein